ncbi:MAG: hypothetical protein DHS20C08_03960 [Rhodomicrobium sp.]|nr:MAG: hypothetical protein DHS20C08_03960 [Rhodomicrobium sp.]
MYEFVRYTFMVLLGLASLVAIFISFALTGAIVAQEDGASLAESSITIYWIWGAMAITGCLWIFGSFLYRVPFTILYWLQDHKDHITAYGVIMLLCVIFVVS